MRTSTNSSMQRRAEARRFNSHNFASMFATNPSNGFFSLLICCSGPFIYLIFFIKQINTSSLKAHSCLQRQGIKVNHIPFRCVSTHFFGACVRARPQTLQPINSSRLKLLVEILGATHSTQGSADSMRVRHGAEYDNSLGLLESRRASRSVRLSESLLIAEAHCANEQQGDKMSSEPGWGWGAKHLLFNTKLSWEGKDKAASRATTATLLPSCQSPLDCGCEDRDLRWGEERRVLIRTHTHTHLNCPQSPGRLNQRLRPPEHNALPDLWSPCWQHVWFCICFQRSFYKSRLDFLKKLKCLFKQHKNKESLVHSVSISECVHFRPSTGHNKTKKNNKKTCRQKRDFRSALSFLGLAAISVWSQSTLPDKRKIESERSLRFKVQSLKVVGAEKRSLKTLQAASPSSGCHDKTTTRPRTANKTSGRPDDSELRRGRGLQVLCSIKGGLFFHHRSLPRREDCSF